MSTRCHTSNSSSLRNGLTKRRCAGASARRSGSSWWTRDADDDFWRFSWDASSLWSSDAPCLGGEAFFDASLVSSEGQRCFVGRGGGGLAAAIAWDPPNNPAPGMGLGGDCPFVMGSPKDAPLLRRIGGWLRAKKELSWGGLPNSPVIVLEGLM